MDNALPVKDDQQTRPPKRGRIRGIPDLTKMKGILTMQARVFREMHMGKLTSKDAFLRICALREIRATVEAMTLTDRLAEVEAMLLAQERNAAPRTITADYWQSDQPREAAA